MEIREVEESQSRHLSIKRPWEDDTNSSKRSNVWRSELRAHIDTIPNSRKPIHERSKPPTWNSQDPRELVTKRGKFDGHDYSTLPQQNSALNGKLTPSRLPNFVHSSLEAPIYPLKPMVPPIPHHNGDVPADLYNSSGLCRRCKRLAIQIRDSDSIGDPDDCEDCKRNPELHRISQECGSMLTQLAETLASGMSSAQGGIIRGHESTGCPPIETYGLQQTLSWVLGKIYHVNYLADQLVRHGPAGSLQNRSSDSSYSHGTKAHSDPADTMKRSIDVDSVDLNDADSSSKTKPPHLRRSSATTSILANEELQPPRSQPDYYPALPPIDGSVQRSSGMNLPAPPRQRLSSPGPGRSLPSPTTHGVLSSSTSSYGVSPHGVNPPPPANNYQKISSNYLPPISVSRSPDSALQDHTAALQHEVSVQKIALSSLQGEHDKLLAAFSRSQTRASTLEKKHAVSDSEIIGLTEEKLRLQAQVNELEKDVEELTRSKDEFRQAAVQEGAQYVEIVQKASRLEEMAVEERRNWGKLKKDMERTIAVLDAGGGNERNETSNPKYEPSTSRPDETSTNAPASSTVLVPEMKNEFMTKLQTTLPTSDTPGPSEIQESVDDLKAEIHRLRKRCADMETTLRTIRDDSHSIEDIVKAFVERADSALQS